MFTDKPESYRGVYSLLLTPFKEDKSIDYDVYAQYVEWQVERGTHHLFSRLRKLRDDDAHSRGESKVRDYRRKALRQRRGRRHGEP